MKNKIVAFISFVVILICCIIPAHAENDANSNEYNVVIAMDSSGSLKETDPNNYRLSAVNLFIQMLANDNNKLGCLSFSTNTLGQKSLTSITQREEKQEIYDTLKATAEKEVQKNGWTNIGSALQSAVNDIRVNGDKNLKSVILLLSDGNTELPSDKETQASLDAKADAVQTARDNNIAIYSVCLNANGEADKKEMEQISNATGGKFIEITKAEDLKDALTSFYSLIYGTDVQTIVDNTFDSKGSTVVPFEVPGTGVDEINIIIYGKAKDIVITKPDKSIVKCDVIESETFSFLKISDILSGEWTVSLSGVPGDKIKVDLLFNTDLSIFTNIKPNQNYFNPDDVITIEAQLKSNNENTNSDNYTKGFTAILRLRDIYGEIVEEIPMTEKDGLFFIEKQIAKGTYKYSVLVEGYNINKESEIKGPITVSNDIDSQEKLANTPPVPVEDPVDIKLNLWPFKDNSFTFDVSGIATDDQDEPLEYRIDSSSFIEGEDYTFDGTTISMSDFSLSKGEFLINAYDKFGESCQVTVHVTTRNIGLISIIIFTVIAILIAIIIIVLLKIARGKAFMGDITVTNLNTYQSATLRKNRGIIKISDFLIGNTGLNGKSFFQATGDNFIYFISKTPVENDYSSGKTKKIKIESNFEVRIYSDSTHENGVEVRFNSYKN